MNQTQSRLVDPFEGQSILSLNPRTFRLSKEALKSKDLEAIHQHMRSMALQNPDKHFEEVRSVAESGSEILNTMESEANLKEKENPQKHRPGLARKRARFSMKPDNSQSSTILEPTFEINPLQDPEAFFAAYEKFENTKKEIKKQRGDQDVDEIKSSTTTRVRRPEMPRRKVSYKHHEYSSQSQNDTLVSQETLQDNIGSPAIHSSQQESKEEEVAGSAAKSNDKFDVLFDELMASNIDKLAGDEAMGYLKDRMKIKPVEINDLKLPEFNDIHRVDFISPIKSLLEEQSILSNTSALPDGAKGKTLGKQKGLSNNPFHSIGTPTRLKSPLSAISTFGKLMFKSVVSVDPFSTHDVDPSPPTITTAKEFPVSSTLAKNKVAETAIGDDKNGSPAPNLSEPQIMEDMDQFHDMENRDADADDNVDARLVATGSQTNEDITEKVLILDDQIKTSVTDPEVNIVVSEVENLSQPDQTDDIEGLDTSVPAQNQNLVTDPVQQNEEHPVTRMEKRKKSTRKVDLKKKRQSLASAGTSWTSGVRKSSRIRRRPLEYWKGERLLYGRVHNSLPTIIGVKYLSPTKENGKEPGFRVESFVSEKYKDLVEWTSLH